MIHMLILSIITVRTVRIMPEKRGSGSRYLSQKHAVFDFGLKNRPTSSLDTAHAHFR